MAVNDDTPSGFDFDTSVLAERSPEGVETEVAQALQQTTEINVVGWSGTSEAIVAEGENALMLCVSIAQAHGCEVTIKEYEINDYIDARVKFAVDTSIHL